MSSASALSLPRGFPGYVALLKQNSNVRNIWLAQVISQIGDWFYSVALLGLINQLTRDPVAPTLFTVFTVLPSAIAGLTFSGYIADKFDRKKLAIAMDIVRAVVALALLFVRSAETLWIAYIAIILLSLGESLFTPAIAAAQPNLCQPHELATANAMQQSTWASVSLIGAYLGGLVAVNFGRETAFVVNALSFLGSAFFLMRIRASFSAADGKRDAPFSLRALTEGFRFMWQRPTLLAVSLIKPIWAFCFSAVGLFSVFAYQVYNTGANSTFAGDIGTSTLYAARGIGSFVGPIVALSLFAPKNAKQSVWVIAGAMVFCVAGYTVWGISQVPLIGALGIFVGHLGGGNVWTFSRVYVQREAPDALRGRILALDYVGFTLVTGAFAFVLGWIARQTSPQTAVLCAVGVTSTLGLLWFGYVLRNVILKK